MKIRISFVFVLVTTYVFAFSACDELQVEEVSELQDEVDLEPQLCFPLGGDAGEVTCGGLVYQREACVGSGDNRYTKDTPVYGINPTSPNSFYIGTCLNGRFTPRGNSFKDVWRPQGDSCGRDLWNLWCQSGVNFVYFRKTPWPPVPDTCE